MLAAENVGTRTTVLARVRGNFPESLIELRFPFTLAGDLISRLEITP